MSSVIELVTAKYAAIKRTVKPLLRNKTDVRFLCYHSVIAGSKIPEITHTPTVTEETFKKHMEIIKELNLEVLSMDKALNILHNGEVTNKTHVCITFDDGYIDNWEVAWPILRQYGYPAHFFITTDWIGGKKIVEKFGKKIEADCMGKPELAKIIEQGGTIGSHSLSHLHLSKEKPDRVFTELKESRNILEKLVEKPIKTFSYPYSDYDSRVLKMLGNTGYDYAFTLDIRPLKRISGKERFKVSRVAIKENESAQRVGIKLLGGYDWAFYYTKIKRRAGIILRK